MITKDEAIAIARARAKENGWGLVEPLMVIDYRGWSGKIKRYRIDSNPAMLGTKTRFTIDANSGAVLEEGYLPR